MISSDLKKIKKNYGEQMMHFCRDTFPTFLEHEGLLYSVMSGVFYPNKELYDDLVKEDYLTEFKLYIESFVDLSYSYKRDLRTPAEVLKEVGYNFYECKTYEDILKFTKYYAPEEQLCSFKKEKRRIEERFVFFAIREDFDKIKREDFNHPDRDDRYGTSIMSIQFSRDSNHTISITNRYNDNDALYNPDSTLENNLENINPGLTDSFYRNYELTPMKEEREFYLSNYVCANDGKYYKYNYEVNNIYYNSKQNIIIKDLKPYCYPMERYILMDYFLLDIQNKKLVVVDDKLDDSFVNCFQNIKHIYVSNNETSKTIDIEHDGYLTKIILDNENNIIEYHNANIIDTGDNYLKYTKSIKKIWLPNVENIGNDFAYFDSELEDINVNKVKNIGNGCMSTCRNVKSIYLNEVENIGDDFMNMNDSIIEAGFPNNKKFGKNFFQLNKCMRKIDVSSGTDFGDFFLYFNEELSEIDFSNAEHFGDCCMCSNNNIETFIAPKVIDIGSDFYNNNTKISTVYAPNLESHGRCYMCSNTNIVDSYTPNLKENNKRLNKTLFKRY